MRRYIDDIKSRIRLSELIAKHVSLKHKGNGEFIGVCPFHNEKTPSFTVSDVKGFYHCFGCNAGGDAIAFIMNYNSLPYGEAIEALATMAGVELPAKQHAAHSAKHQDLYQIFEHATNFYRSQLSTYDGSKALEYLKMRGLQDEIVDCYRLGYAPENSMKLWESLKNAGFSPNAILASKLFTQKEYGPIDILHGRVIFPIINKSNKVIAFGGRIMSASNSRAPKYINSAENELFHKREQLYGLHQAVKEAYKTGEMIICEGYMDVLSLANAGIKNAVAPLGTALSVEVIQYLWTIVNEPMLCFDNDNAGHKAMSKVAYTILPYLAAGKSVRFINIKDAKDPDEVIQKFGAKAFQSAAEQAQGLCAIIFAAEVDKRQYDTPERFLDLQKRLDALALQIQDRDLAYHYKVEWRQKHRALKFQKFVKKTAPQKASYSADMDQNHIITAFLTILSYPALLQHEDLMHEIVSLNIRSKNIDKLRSYVISLNDVSNIRSILCAKDEILNTISQQFNMDIGQLNSLYRLFISEEAAKQSVIHAFKAQHLEGIRQQIAAVADELVHNPTSENFERLSALKKVEECVERELYINQQY